MVVVLAKRRSLWTSSGSKSGLRGVLSCLGVVCLLLLHCANQVPACAWVFGRGVGGSIVPTYLGESLRDFGNVALKQG